ncbi:hypothetical protein Tco_0878921 [Tanacetum coccineum]|uniref:Uncharacterized protein n=1 Tax=Tanacetum coccineum TaxID=301880 RepID=A0ABQ5BZ74_9ASTR
MHILRGSEWCTMAIVEIPKIDHETLLSEYKMERLGTHPKIPPEPEGSNPRDYPLFSSKVLRYDNKRSNVENEGKMRTMMDYTRNIPNKVYHEDLTLNPTDYTHSEIVWYRKGDSLH